MSGIPISAYRTFGDLLKFLRKRAQLTQRELAIAVGYSEAHLSRLEKNERLPDLATVAARFVPVLGLDDEPDTVATLMQLAANSHGQNSHSGFTLSRVQETTAISEGGESIPTNLPLQLTTFIGRQTEIAEITDMLARENPVRLITLTGPGGIGKTRLALQTTIGLTHHYPAGIWFVDLSALSTPELLPHTLAFTVSIPETRGRSIEETIITHLRSKHLLIVLDNCEHLILAAAQLTEKILRSCADVQVLATSREPLHIPGEVNYRLSSLSLSESRDGIGNEAAQLFIERAKNIQPSFAVNEANLPVIARICQRLDGMPLAIELAAARTNFLGLNQLEVRLSDRFQLLTGGEVTLPRHQTLRATLEWSHDLLSEDEQILFRRLAVFAGGWTLDSANAVCAENGSDILNPLAGLFNKSLVVVERQPGDEVRYRMLETIREYAREKLRAADEMETLRARHFEAFLEKARQGESNLFSAESSIDWAETEIDNLRAALAWALEKDAAGAPSADRAGHGLMLMLHVWLLWWTRGYSTEANEWLHRLLAAHAAATPIRARALLLAADLAGFRGDYMAKLAFAQESLVIAQRLAEKKPIADATMVMGLVERDIRHIPEAIEFLMEALAMFEELKENLWTCRVSFLLAEAHLLVGNFQETRFFLRRGMEICRADNDRWQIGWGLEVLGNVERLEGHLEEAGKHYAESLNLRVEVMDKTGIAFALESFALLAAAREEFTHAAVLWGAVDGLRQTLNQQVDPLREDLRAAPLSATREQLGEEIFTKAWAKGKAMMMDEAVEFALASLHD